MPLIHLKTRFVEYKFEIHGKYTIIQGDSGTGKTTFSSLIKEIDEESKSVQNMSGVQLVPIRNDRDIDAIKNFNNIVFVIDEFSIIYRRKEFASILKNSNNYFILINRNEEKLACLPLHTDNIYVIKSSGRFHTIERKFKHFDTKEIVDLDTIIVEDSKSGYKFIEDICNSYGNEHDIKLSAAYGDKIDYIGNKTSSASNITKSLLYQFEHGSKSILLVLDYCGFGAYMNELLFTIQLLQSKVLIYVIDYDSFEGYILGSPMYDKKYTIKDVDCNVNDFEEFLTSKLKQVIPSYSKDNLCKCLRTDRCVGCKHGTGCNYRIRPYTDLIYDKLEPLFNFLVKNKMNGKSSEFSATESHIF